MAMKTLSLRVSDTLDKTLQREAKRRRTSKTALVKKVLEDHFAARNGHKKATVGELAGDLIGCLEGPGDLSYNPKYLEGFGK